MGDILPVSYTVNPFFHGQGFMYPNIASIRVIVSFVVRFRSQEGTESISCRSFVAKWKPGLDDRFRVETPGDFFKVGAYLRNGLSKQRSISPASSLCEEVFERMFPLSVNEQEILHRFEKRRP